MPITVLGADTHLGGSGGGGGGALADQLDANGTTLDVDAIADGQMLVRSGTSIVGAAINPGDITAVVAGAGMTGGATSGSATLDVVANADGSIVVNANDVQVGILATDAQHGVRGGGTQHSNAVAAGAAGFMTGADKSKLDGITAGAAVASVTAGAGLVNSGTATAVVADVVAADASIIVAADSIRFGDTIPDARTFSGIITLSSGAVLADGSAGTPALRHAADLDTGTFFPGADRWAVSTAGTQRLEVSTTAIISTLPHSNAVGTAGAPSYSFTAQLTDGIFSPGAGRVAIATSGVQRFEVNDATSIISTLPYSSPLGAVGAPAYSFTGDLDTGWYSPGAGQVSLALDGVQRVAWAANGMTSTPVAATSGSPTHWSWTGAAHTGLTATVEATDFDMNLARTVTWATGTIALQRAVRLRAPTYAMAGAGTITDASTLAIDSGPVAGAGPVTLTRTWAISVHGTGQIGANVGTAANPGYAFFGDQDTGVFQNGANVVALSAGGALKLSAGATTTSFFQTITTSGSATVFDFNPPASTGQTAGTEQLVYRLRAATVQHASNTTVATQRHAIWEAPTYSFASASGNITDAATVAIVDGPIAGTNATIANSYALWLQAGMFRADGALRWTADISPTQLTANQNNYAPTGFATCFHIRQDVDATGRTITGLAGGADGRTILFTNSGVGATNNITLTHDDTGNSTAANCFYLPNAVSLVLLQFQSVWLHYDSTASRWIVMS